jgi:hypothetical protein
MLGCKIIASDLQFVFKIVFILVFTGPFGEICSKIDAKMAGLDKFKNFPQIVAQGPYFCLYLPGIYIIYKRQFTFLLPNICSDLVSVKHPLSALLSLNESQINLKVDFANRYNRLPYFPLRSRRRCAFWP